MSMFRTKAFNVIVWIAVILLLSLLMLTSQWSMVLRRYLYVTVYRYQHSLLLFFFPQSYSILSRNGSRNKRKSNRYVCSYVAAYISGSYVTAVTYNGNGSAIIGFCNASRIRERSERDSA